MKAYYGKEIITPDGAVTDAYLLEEEGSIVKIDHEPPAGVPVIAYEQCTLAPGLIDVHTHGALGYEVGYGDRVGLDRWSSFNLAHGITGFLPSTASIPQDRMERAAMLIRAASSKPLTNILGLHLEGPFFAPTPKIGAQNPRYIRTTFTEADKEFLAANRDVVRYIAVDPSLATAEEIVTYCAGLGLRVAAAHSEITYEDFRAKKKWGYTAITHAFNGMSGLDHRRPGLAYAACLDQDLYSEIICDGHHVHFLLVEMLLRLKDWRKTILITDSMAATGMPPGAYTLGGMEVRVAEDGRVTKGDGGLAGSTLTLDQAVRNLVRELGIPLTQAVYMASMVPAEMLGLADDRGSLARGKRADFIVLDRELKVVATYLQGREVFRRADRQV